MKILWWYAFLDVQANNGVIHVINKVMLPSYAEKKVSVVAIGKKANDALSKDYEILANESTWEKGK